MRHARSRHDTAVLEDYYSISVFLLQFINENYLTEQMAFKTALYKLTRADLFDDWEEAISYLIQVSEALFEVMDDNEVTLTERVLHRVIEYIDTHLSEDLSLTYLADLSGFNSSYLSRLFKQVKKENISDYILHKRMKLAKKMLLETNEKVQDIAVKTGYMSAHSFARVFRKETGLAPKEYREMGGE